MNDVIFAERQLTPSVPRHQHRHWEMYYCTDSTGAFVFDDLELPYRAGSIIVIPPDTSHAHVTAAAAGSIFLYIADATLSFRFPMMLEDDENQSLLHLFADAHYLFHHGQESQAALLAAYGQLISQHISVRRSASPRNLLVEEIAKNIVQNYTNPNYELDELLRSAPYCYDYLCRLFRQEMHTTPHKYLAELRMQAAADLLRMGGSRSITEIARMCGYHDPLYFSRMFKKRYGVSPREYYRQQRLSPDSLPDS